MSRRVRIGDLAIVKTHGQKFEHKVTSITKEGIMLDNRYLIEPPDWQLKEMRWEHTIEFIPMSPEIDLNKLLEFDYKTIKKLCKDGDYYYVCSSEEFWKKLVDRDFPGVSEYKPDKTTYKDVYEDIYYMIDVYNKRNDHSYTYMNDLETIIESIIHRGHLHVLVWFARKGVEFNSEDADSAVEYNNLPILIWLASKDILPNPEAVEIAIINGNLEIVKWLYNHGLKPTPEAVEIAKSKQNKELVEWLNEQM
jgi:hypothetical protein